MFRRFVDSIYLCQDENQYKLLLNDYSRLFAGQPQYGWFLGSHISFCFLQW